jgi:hypothetical protein
VLTKGRVPGYRLQLYLVCDCYEPTVFLDEDRALADAVGASHRHTSTGPKLRREWRYAST